MKAAFIKESDVFKENGITYLDPILNIDDKKLLGLQMFQTWGPILGLSEEENDRALEAGFKAFEDYDRSMRKRSREVLDTLERENRLGIVMLGRVYHHDPGLESRDHGGVPEARATRCSRRACCRWMRTSWTGCSAKRFAPARSRTRSIFATCGRTPTPAAPT